LLDELGERRAEDDEARGGEVSLTEGEDKAKELRSMRRGA